ncbi:MAG: peptidoglycan-binding domain-containing protein [Patescibacteria group bacterium]
MRGSVLVALLIAAVLVSAHTASASVIGILSGGRDLSVGASGSDVADLQGLLAEQGYLVIPIGVAPGYFGSLTQAGLARYQASIGVPSTGYFGPMTRTRLSELFTARGWMALFARENG